MKLSMMRELSQRFPPPKNQEEANRVWEILRQEGYAFENFYQEMEMSSPMAETHRDESYTNETMTLHSHDFYEMLYIQSSDNVEYLVGTERYRLKPGDILMVAPGISHRPLLPETMAEPYRRIAIWLSREFMALIRQMLPGSPMAMPGGEMIFLRTKNTEYESLGTLFCKGVEEAEAARPGWEGIVLGNTITIAAQITRAMVQPHGAPPKAEKPLLLDRCLAYIEDHLGERITLEETARQFYVSASTISLLFRQKMSTSFYRCVTQRRLIAAKLKIEQGQSLENVSRAVGFTDYSSFYRAFKKEYGITPRQYARR